MKGLTLYVYRTHERDCTLGGVSSKANRLTLVGDGIPEIDEATEDAPEIVLQRSNAVNSNDDRQISLRLIPPHLLDERRWTMFGGNFATTCDSRLGDAIERITGRRFFGAIPIHDRVENY